MNVFPLWRPKTYTPTTGLGAWKIALWWEVATCRNYFWLLILQWRSFWFMSLFTWERERETSQRRKLQGHIISIYFITSFSPKRPNVCQKPIAQQTQYPLELCSFCHPVNWWPLLLTYSSHFWQEKQYLSGGEAAEAPSGGYVIVEPTNWKNLKDMMIYDSDW